MDPFKSRQPGASLLRKSLAVSAFGAALLSLLAAAQGQAQYQNRAEDQSPPGTSVPAPKPISDQKLGAAAAAMQQVSTLRQTYQQQIAQAPDSDKPRLTGEANQALAKAVTDQGLSLDEYNSILQEAQRNPTVRDGLLQRMGQSGAQPATPSKP